jgi:hypothetical protein
MILGMVILVAMGILLSKTPDIDKFAQEGVPLTDCHSGGTVCSPSRTALLTGRNPYRLGFYNIQGGSTYLKSKEITIAEILKTKGYTTCFMGKWHLSVLEKKKVNEPGPGDQGFDYWMGTTHNAFDGPANTKEFIRNGVPVGQVNGWFCNVIVDEQVTGYAKKGTKQNLSFFMLPLMNHILQSPRPNNIVKCMIHHGLILYRMEKYFLQRISRIIYGLKKSCPSYECSALDTLWRRATNCFSKMMGHTKEETTKNYYDINIPEIVEGTRRVDFKKLGI